MHLCLRVRVHYLRHQKKFTMRANKILTRFNLVHSFCCEGWRQNVSYGQVIRRTYAGYLVHMLAQIYLAIEESDPHSSI